MKRITSTKTGAKQKQATLETTKLVRASEELKEWAALLAGEAASWPGVHAKHMFGLISLYRKDKIFAALPRTRALSAPHSIIFKFHTENSETRKARKQLTDYPASGWVSLELQTGKDLGLALRWLELAYRLAK